jgi:hypothetical protein
MAGSDYTHGEMDISEQARTWDGFVNFTLWGSGLILLILAYATFTVAMGMNWIVALVLCAIGGILGGMFMGMGGAWIAAVIAMSALAVIVQVIIMLAGAFS